MKISLVVGHARNIHWQFVIATLFCFHMYADDVIPDASNVAVEWDFSALASGSLPVSVKNSGSKPAQFSQDIRYGYTLGDTADFSETLKAFPFDADSNDTIFSVFIFIQKQGDKLHLVSSPSAEAPPHKIDPGQNITFKYKASDDLVSSFNGANGMYILLVKGGKVFKTVKMEKQGGVWRER